VLIVNDVTTSLVAVDAGMQARDGEILEEDVTVATTPDGQTVLAHLVDATLLFALAHDEHAETLGTCGRGTRSAGAVGVGEATSIVAHRPTSLSTTLGPGWCHRSRCSGHTPLTTSPWGAVPASATASSLRLARTPALLRRGHVTPAILRRGRVTPS